MEIPFRTRFILITRFETGIFIRAPNYCFLKFCSTHESGVRVDDLATSVRMNEIKFFTKDTFGMKDFN